MSSATPLPAAGGAEPASTRARALIGARRHSRLVRVLRRTLEIGVVCLALGLVGKGLLRNFGHVLRDVTFEGIGIEGGRITMDKPHLSGSRPGGAGYDITAVKAMQDALHPGEVDLALIGGEITAVDHEVNHLSAASGHYQSGGETLELNGDVKLTNTRYELYLNSVHVEFKKGDYVSNEPVKVRILPDSTITADSLAVKEGGAQVHFEGHVRTLLNGQQAALDKGTP